MSTAVTGPGMPIFSTKDVGKGADLGLAIARRLIVERHRGTIRIGFRPSAITVRIRLRGRPRAPPPPY